ncbi:MAG: inositol monophosphatase family protein, partial [Marmoricola sp.]
RRDDRVVAGVVRNPAADLEYVARLGGGATCNGTPLRVRSTPSLDQALVGTGFGYETRARARQAQAAARMLPQVRDIRRQGSCALDLCAVAAGTLDAYVEEGPHVWDHAAGALVAQEAGARVEVWTTAAAMELVVAAPEDGWQAFSDLVRDCGYLDDPLML